MPDLIPAKDGIFDRHPVLCWIPACTHWRQLKRRSNGFGNNVVAGFIPASAAGHAAAHRLIKRKSIKDRHQVPGGDKQAA